MAKNIGGQTSAGCAASAVVDPPGRCSGTFPTLAVAAGSRGSRRLGEADLGGPSGVCADAGRMRREAAQAPAAVCYRGLGQRRKAPAGTGRPWADVQRRSLAREPFARTSAGPAATFVGPGSYQDHRIRQDSDRAAFRAGLLHQQPAAGHRRPTVRGENRWQRHSRATASSARTSGTTRAKYG